MRETEIDSRPFAKLGTPGGAVNVRPGANTDWVTSHDIAPIVVAEAFTFALDPTPEQASAMRSPVGGSRFAYNALLGLVKANWYEKRAKKEDGLEVVNEGYVSTPHFGQLNDGTVHRKEVDPSEKESGGPDRGFIDSPACSKKFDD